MGGFLGSVFGKKDARVPINGIAPKLKNLFTMHYRGLIGMLVPVCALTWQGEKGRNDITVQCMWMWMFWFYLLQPVNVPVTSLIPIFCLPMAGVMSSAATCSCYMNEFTLLFLISGMLLLLLNNSGADRRISLWLICCGDPCQFSGQRLVLKCSTAAFFLSMFSNRLIVTSTIIQYMTPPLIALQAATSRANDPDFHRMRYIINNAIQTSAAIGSTAILHAALTTIIFKAVFMESAEKGHAYPDLFNFLQYSAFAFPVAFLMFIFNFIYHMILINRCLRKPMTHSAMSELRSCLQKQRAALPRKTSLHEKLSILFTFIALIVFFCRWSKYLDKGWADFSQHPLSSEVPTVTDTTISAVFVLLLHVLPKGCGYLKFFSAEKKSELPPIKAESAILFWRFVDKNTNYGYFIVFGAAVSLVKAIRLSGLGHNLSGNFGTYYTGHSWNTSIFLICFTSVILANMMTGGAACLIFCPFVVMMSLEPDAPEVWQTNAYIGALAVGIATSFGFMSPFLYSPAYFCHHVGKVPKIEMAKYSLVSCFICMIILWLALCHWAPIIWSPYGYSAISLTLTTTEAAETTTTTTAAGAGGGGGGAGGGGGGGAGGGGGGGGGSGG